MARKKKRKPVRIAHELSRTRRKAIEKALEEHQVEDRVEWDRNSEWSDYRFYRKLVKRGTVRTIDLPLLEVTIGDPWSTSVTVIHGKRPGPTITILGGMHGDELTGPSACTHLLSTAFTDTDKPLDPETLAGTIRIVPVVNMPGYRSKSRYFPDGRDLNRNFPGNSKGSSTRRVAAQVWKYLVEDSDAIIDLHSAGKGRSNMPQLRVDLAHAGSNILAKAFGIEILLDSKPPKGSLRFNANEEDIPSITYEGGGANWLDQASVKVAVHGVMNVLRKLKMVPGKPHRPRFRMLASGSTWLRAGEGGLLDLFVDSGSIMKEGDVVARISDPATPGLSVDILAPEDGLMICIATNPFVAAGMPVGHFLPVSKHMSLLEEQVDGFGRFITQGSLDEPVWREEEEIEVEVRGEWDGGSVDSGWIEATLEEANRDDSEEEEET